MLLYLQNLALADWVRSSTSLFAYGTVLTAHAVGLAISIGCNTIIALRLLGIAPGIPLAGLRQLYGYAWAGFFINLTSGIMLFIAEAVSMAHMWIFWAKMICVMLGMIIGQLLRSYYFSDVASVQAGVVTPIGRKLAITSLVVWYLALIVGRLTGYPDLVNGWLGLSLGSV